MEKIQSVNANIWVRNNTLFASMCEFHPVCDSFPSMLIKSVCVCLCSCLKRKKNACNFVFKHMYVCVCVLGQVYAFYVCMKCVGVWVGAGLCKYWCIAVRKAITNSGPQASLYWEERELGGGGRHTQKDTHTQKEQPQMLTQSHIRTDTRTQTNVDEVAEWGGQPSCSQWEHTQPSRSILAVIYRGAIRFQCGAPAFCC